MVNLELYRVFHTVARCGSLTRAAEELFISQPAVSQAIRQLETQLGMTLFKRTHKGMELTAQGGELVFSDVERALKLLEGVEAKISQLQQSAHGTLRIGASETIFQYVLADKLMKYHKIYPQVKFELVSDVTPKIVDLLRNDRLDVGFLNLPCLNQDGIRITQSIKILHYIFIAGEEFSQLKGKEISVWELQKYPLILMEPHTVSRSSIDGFFGGLGVQAKPAIEVDSWGFMKRLVADGMGIGCLPREYSLNKLSDGSIFELNVTPALPSRGVGMALPKEENISFALRAFLNLFHE